MGPTFCREHSTQEDNGTGFERQKAWLWVVSALWLLFMRTGNKSRSENQLIYLFDEPWGPKESFIQASLFSKVKKMINSLKYKIKHAIDSAEENLNAGSLGIIWKTKRKLTLHLESSGRILEVDLLSCLA